MSALFAAAEAPVSRWPFVVLLVSVTFIIIAITRLRMHAFIALIFAAFLAGFLAEPFSPAVLEKLPKGARAAAEGNHWLATVELTMVEFGNTAAAISISIGLAGGKWVPAGFFALFMGVVTVGGLIIVELYPPQSRAGWLAWTALVLAYLSAWLSALLVQT